MTEAAMDAKRAYRREYMRKWRKENPDKCRQYVKAWRKNNPEAVKRYNDEYWERVAKRAQDESGENVADEN